MVSNASDDLPEPDNPVMTVRLLRGISTVMFLRLCSRAPRTINASLEDRKSTRLNSSHGYISYAVFCLKKKKKKNVLNISDNNRSNRITQLDNTDASNN